MTRTLTIRYDSDPGQLATVPARRARLVGTAAEVRRELALAGDRVTAIDRPTRDRHGRVVVDVTLLPLPAQQRARPAAARLVGATAAALVTLLAAGVLAGRATAIPLRTVGGGFAVAALLAWWVLGQVGACPGLHCLGCRCHR